MTAPFAPLTLSQRIALAADRRTPETRPAPVLSPWVRRALAHELPASDRTALR